MPVVGGQEILSRKLGKALKQNVDEGEHILFCLLGNFKHAIVALSTGVLVIKPGFMAGATFGARVARFMYEDITGIEINTGLLNGVIEISTPSYQATKAKDWWCLNPDRDPMKLSNCLPIRKKDLHQYQPYLETLRMMIEDAKQRKAPTLEKAGADIASQLERLAELYRSGSLNEEEFQAAKRRILGS